MYYFLLGNIFNKGLDKDDQKEGVFKRLKDIKDKNGELLKVFRAANKVSKAAKSERDFNFDSNYAFYNFTEALNNFEGLN